MPKTRAQRQQALTAPTAPSTPEPVRHGTNYVPTKTRFLDLPYELREMIYIHALVVRPASTEEDSGQDVEVPLEPNHWRSSRKPGPTSKVWQTHQRLQRPNIMLLATRKEIHDEAAAILYGKNTFRLPAAAKLSDKFLELYAQYFQSVVVDMPRYTLLCGDPRFHYNEKMAAMASFDRRQIPKDTVITAVEEWHDTRMLLGRLEGLKNVHVKIKGWDHEWQRRGVFYGFPPVALQWWPTHGPRLDKSTKQATPYLKDWRGFVFGKDESDELSEARPRPWPLLSAQFERKMNDVDTTTIKSIWKQSDVVRFRYMKTGCWGWEADSEIVEVKRLEMASQSLE